MEDKIYWDLSMRRGANGYVIRTEEGIIWTFQDQAPTEPEEEGLSQDNIAGLAMLHWLMDYYGLQGTKHDKARIRINVESQ